MALLLNGAGGLVTAAVDKAEMDQCLLYLSLHQESFPGFWDLVSPDCGYRKAQEVQAVNEDRVRDSGKRTQSL